MVAAWNDELRRLGFRDPHQPTTVLLSPRIGELDRIAAVELVLTRLGVKRSAWNAADSRGHVEQRIAGTALVADATSGSGWPRTLPLARSRCAYSFWSAPGRARARPGVS